MENNPHRFEILKAEFLLTQQQMDKYDQMATTTKTWALTLWVASSGWAFQVQRHEVFLLSIVVVATFWFFDALNKTFRTHYKDRRDKVTGALRGYYATGELSPSFVAPQLPPYTLAGMRKNAFLPHLMLPYIVLILISVALYGAL